MRVGVGRARGEAFVTIEDDGVGIEPEHLHTIFELFNQVEVDSDRRAGGLGVGLALVRQLVELHGGVVTAESDGVGQGSSFKVRLPLWGRHEEAVTPRSAPAVIERVLVVDDNEDILEMVEAMLTARGFEVICAKDGMTALRKAERERPDAVLLDIGLPRLNGLEVAARLRANPRFSRIPIVAMSGYGQVKDRRRSLAAGFDEHLIKPFAEEDLLALLRGGDGG